MHYCLKADASAKVCFHRMQPFIILFGVTTTRCYNVTLHNLAKRKLANEVGAIYNLLFCRTVGTQIKKTGICPSSLFANKQLSIHFSIWSTVHNTDTDMSIVAI
jgi:hypothetical protein